MITQSYEKLPLMHFPKMHEQKGICHFITTREGGVSKPPFDSFNMSYSTDDPRENITSNRRKLVEAIGIENSQLIFQKQIHSDIIKIIEEPVMGVAHGQSDGMITNTPDLCICAMGADCVPVLFYDPIQKAIGVAHAGWKGTVQKIAAKTVVKMQEKYGCKPDNIMVGIGPSMGPENYEVGDEVFKRVKEAFPDFFDKVTLKKNKWHFDMWAANKLQLMDVGVLESNIDISGICTYDRTDMFYSHRRSGGATGRFAAGIMLKG